MWLVLGLYFGLGWVVGVAFIIWRRDYSDYEFAHYDFWPKLAAETGVILAIMIIWMPLVLLVVYRRLRKQPTGLE